MKGISTRDSYYSCRVDYLVCWEFLLCFIGLGEVDVETWLLVYKVDGVVVVVGLFGLMGLMGLLKVVGLLGF